MANFSLDPKLGMEAAQIMERELNGIILEYVSAGFKAVETLGDNNVVDAAKDKFMSLSAYYNGPYMEAMTSVQKNMGEYTDFADYVAKLQIDSAVKAEDVDPAKDAGFGDAAAML